jgi:hypothetical protein
VPTLQQRFHYPFSFVSAQLTNSKGYEIFYPVTDDRDRQWARRLGYAIDRHREIAEDDIEELHADFFAVLRESKEPHERKYDQAYIADLEGKLAAASRQCASRAKAAQQTRENAGPLPIFENRASLGFNDNFNRIYFSACMRIKAVHGNAAGEYPVQAPQTTGADTTAATGPEPVQLLARGSAQLLAPGRGPTAPWLVRGARRCSRPGGVAHPVGLGRAAAATAAASRLLSL